MLYLLLAIIGAVLIVAALYVCQQTKHNGLQLLGALATLVGLVGMVLGLVLFRLPQFFS